MFKLPSAGSARVELFLEKDLSGTPQMQELRPDTS